MIIKSLNFIGTTWHGEKLDLSPGFNLVRGANGSGKTYILECASLLGHLCVIKEPLVNQYTDFQVSIETSFTDSDFAFIRLLKARINDKGASDKNKAAIKQYELLLKKTLELSLQQLVDLLRRSEIQREFTAKFSFDETNRLRLKELLANEGELVNSVNAQIQGIDPRIPRAIQLWTRPIEDGPQTWFFTPHFISRRDDSATKERGFTPPGSTFYINTDMYEFGIGLDIRESPKQMQTHATLVLTDRLQLMNVSFLDHTCNKQLSVNAIQGRSFYPFLEDRIYDSWKTIFDKNHPLTVLSMRKDPESTISWVFTISGVETMGFVSSGENQLAFVLTVLHGQLNDGSCMLLDEPELHLSFSAAAKLLEEIQRRVIETRSQAIVVSHLPHLYRDRTLRELNSKASEKDPHDYSTIHQIYLPGHNKGSDRFLIGQNAIEAAAASSADDLMGLIKGIRLAEDVPYFGPWPRLLVFFRSSPLKRAFSAIRSAYNARLRRPS